MVDYSDSRIEGSHGESYIKNQPYQFEINFDHLFESFKSPVSFLLLQLQYLKHNITWHIVHYNILSFL